MIVELKLARAALQQIGWVGPEHEPWCLDSRGRRVLFDDEGLHKYSVAGALEQHGVREAGLELLHRVVSPRLAELSDFVDGYCAEPAKLTLEDAGEEATWVDLAGESKWWRLRGSATGEYLSAIGWLQESGRSLADVLGAFTAAIGRSKKAATGERR